MISLTRTTKETTIQLSLDLESTNNPQIDTGLPFFNHILYAMAFHGGFYLSIKAQGDLEVDPHHLVEDTGLVLGDALQKTFIQQNSIRRYGYAAIPMDEALSEVVIDVCNRSAWVYRVELPQTHAGTFDLCLIREFWIALTNKAQINLHGHCRYGENAHHMIEALFKALGKAIKQAYQIKEGSVPSTKGVL